MYFVLSFALTIMESFSSTITPRDIDEILCDQELMDMCDNFNNGQAECYVLQQVCMPTPKYAPKLMARGSGVDKFFDSPANKRMADNASVVSTLANGSDAEVLSLPNLCCPAPTSSHKCEVATESLMFSQATFTLLAEYGVQSMPDVYRHLGMMSDRRCVSCPTSKIDLNIGCVMGSFRCVNCIRAHGPISFNDGFKAWMAAGSPARHGVRMA